MHIRNRCFNDRLGKTPYNMHVFGAVCYAYVQGSKKLEPKSKEGIFVGYDKNSPTYLVYYPESMKVERVRCVKFFDSTEFDNSRTVKLTMRLSHFPAILLTVSNKLELMRILNQLFHQ